MEMIKISDTKLKIMLSALDMDKYNISNDSIFISNTHLGDTLRKILADAGQTTDFVGNHARIYVQMFPCIKGGCELFICKQEDEDACNQQKSGNLPPPDRPTLPEPYTKAQSSVALAQYGRDVVAVSFTSMQDMVDLCRRLSCIGYCSDSIAYTDDKSKYYLFLCGIPAPSLYSLDQYCFICEYGVKENLKLLKSYISEYGRLICRERAVQSLAQL